MTMYFPGYYQPTITKFPIAMDLDDVKKYINTLRIDHVNNIYKIPVEYKGFITEMEVSYTDEPYPQFNLQIQNGLNELEPCLHLRIYTNNNKVMGKLVFVRSKDVKCVIPGENAGTWLVELSNEIFHSLGIRVIVLEDDSVVNCSNGQIARFFMLRVYRGDFRSWYSNFGYRNNFNTKRVQRLYPGYDENNFMEDMKLLQSFPMEIITEGIFNTDYERISPIFRQAVIEDVNKATNILQKYNPDYKNLGEYMTNLWSINCDGYITMDKFLRTTSRSDVDLLGNIFPWTPLFRRLEFVSYDYINE